MKLKNVKPILEKVLGAEFVKTNIEFTFDQSQVVTLPGVSSGSGTKPVFLKPMSNVLRKHPKYTLENILLVDDSPYKSSMNPFFSSLYPPSFIGDENDDFLRRQLLPYLIHISTTTDPLHSALEQTYPSWSIESLQRDWMDNKQIWTSAKFQLMAHASQLLEFSNHTSGGERQVLFAISFNFVESYFLKSCERLRAGWSSSVALIVCHILRTRVRRSRPYTLPIFLQK